jgi:hypothetical protein
MVVTKTCLGLARSYQRRLVMAPTAPLVLAPRGLPQIWKYETLYKCNAWGVKSSKLHAHAQLTHGNPYEPFTNLPIVFFSNLVI